MTRILHIALGYHAAGLGVLPVRADGSKAPALPRGHPFLYRRPTEADLRRWFAAGRHGIAIACGAVSGNLETLDFETTAVYRRWRERVEARVPGLADRLCWVLTPGHLGARGVHGRYRCPGIAIPGPTPLAYEPVAEGAWQGDLSSGSPPRRRLLIETRGEGSYAIAPGSPPGCHVTGRPWEHVAGPGLQHLSDVTLQEREVLLSAARALDRFPAQPPVPSHRPFVTGLVGPFPGGDYNRRGPDWSALLGPHGWEVVRAAGAVRYWRRPGKHGAGWSATTGYCRAADGCDLLHVFSSNASPFRPHGSYSKFRAYALLCHAGDYRVAARELARRGYGVPRSRTSTLPRGSPQPAHGRA